MKKFSFLILAACCLFSLNANCQKYKTADDTIKLNKEYLKLVADTAGLRREIEEGETDLQKYRSVYESKQKLALESAEASSKQADKATDGDTKHAKKAKKLAGDAYDDRKKADDAKDDIKKQEKKLAKLNKQLTKKTERLQELDKMKAAILQLDAPIPQ